MAGAALVGVGGCGAPVAVAAAPELAVAAGWLSDVMAGVAATLIADAVTWVATKGWEAWVEPTKALLHTQTQQGWKYHDDNLYGHPQPSTAFTGVYRDSVVEDSSDRMLATLSSGDGIVFESWAWRGLHGFATSVTDGLDGNNLHNAKQALADRVLPHGKVFDSGTTRNKTASWLTFPALRGEVEIIVTRTSAAQRVTVTATNFESESSSQGGTVKTFELASQV